MRRAEAIIDELTVTLDHERGGEVASRLQGIYAFCRRHLIEARLEQDPAKIEEVSELLGELREAWAEIAPAERPRPPGPSWSTLAERERDLVRRRPLGRAPGGLHAPADRRRGARRRRPAAARPHLERLPSSKREIHAGLSAGRAFTLQKLGNMDRGAAAMRGYAGGLRPPRRRLRQPPRLAQARLRPRIARFQQSGLDPKGPLTAGRYGECAPRMEPREVHGWTAHSSPPGDPSPCCLTPPSLRSSAPSPAPPAPRGAGRQHRQRSTPGYRRVDVDFHGALAAALGSSDASTAVERTGFTTQADSSVGVTQADGNSIDIDDESAKLAANALEQQAAVPVAKTRIAILQVRDGCRLMSMFGGIEISASGAHRCSACG